MPIEYNSQSLTTLSLCRQELDNLDNEVRNQTIIEWDCGVNNTCRYPNNIQNRVECCMDYDIYDRITDRIKHIHALEKCSAEEIKQIKVEKNKAFEIRGKVCGEDGCKSEMCETLKTGFSSKCKEEFRALWNKIYDELRDEWNCEFRKINTCIPHKDLVEEVKSCSYYDIYDKFPNDVKGIKQCDNKMLTIVNDSVEVRFLEYNKSCKYFENRSENCTQLKKSVLFSRKCLSNIEIFKNKTKEKVMKSWECDPDNKTNCRFPNQLLEGVKCCMTFDRKDEVMNEVKSMGQCDLKMKSRFKNIVLKEIEEMKQNCTQFEYHSESCENLKDPISSDCREK
jgi:hypothetical protein